VFCNAPGTNLLAVYDFLVMGEVDNKLWAEGYNAATRT
jgi:hypothetical protein